MKFLKVASARHVYTKTKFKKQTQKRTVYDSW